MRKKLFTVLASILLISLCGCSQNTTDDKYSQNEVNNQTNESDDAKKESLSSKDENTEKESSTDEIKAINDGEELEESVLKDVEDTINALNEKWDGIQAEIDTYEKYKNDTKKIEEFYNSVYVEIEALNIRLYQYALDYAKAIMAEDNSIDDKYDEFDGLYDCIYEDAGDEIYDEIYDGILDEMYDVYYDGLLDEAYDTVPYSEWSDLRSDEYDWWSDTRSDVYDIWSDTRSDIYDFWSDIRSKLWDDDIDKANDIMDEFAEDVEKIKKD